MAKKRLSATDIFDQLHASSNRSPVFTGLIDKVPDDNESIRIARATDDPEWTNIPTSAIEKVHFVQTAQAKGGTYPLVHVFFKEPQADEGRAFAALAHLHRPVAQLSNYPPDCPPGQHRVRTNAGWRCVDDDRPPSRPARSRTKR